MVRGDTGTRRECDPEVTYVNGSASHDAVYENGKLTWYVETLEPGASVTLKFQAKLPMDNAAGSWKNVAKLTYQNDPEGPEHETPSNEVEVKKDPNKVPTTSTNGKPHPGASAPTATNTGILTWTLLAHETPSNEVEVKKDPNKVPTTSTNGKPHPGASAPTATNTGILTWTLLAAGAGSQQGSDHIHQWKAASWSQRSHCDKHRYPDLDTAGSRGCDRCCRSGHGRTQTEKAGFPETEIDGQIPDCMTVLLSKDSCKSE